MNRSIFAVGILALVGCFSLGAQSMKLKASIPFEFRIGQRLMPPGEYTVTHSAGLLTLSSSGTNHDFAATIVFGSQRRPANAAIHQLLFNRYGEEYFLSRVWHAGEKSGLQVQQGKTEKELIGRSSGPVQTASVQLRAR